MATSSTTSLLMTGIRSRPIRVAYLVDAATSSPDYLDKVFAYSVGYWGGRFHGVFPVVAGNISDPWWKPLELLDPDVVVTNTNLTHSCLDRIERCVLPSRYLGLTESERNRCADHPYVPIHGLDLVDTTAIPQQIWARRGPLQDPLFVRFKPRHPVDDVHRVVLRNFGVLPDDVSTRAAFADLPVEEIDDSAFTIDELFRRLTEIGSHAVLPVDLASHAAAFPAHLEYDPHDRGFHLTIGESCFDAAYHWNRVFSSHPGHGHLSLWLPTAAVSDDQVVAAVAAWIEQSYWQSEWHRTGSIVSFSLDDAQLNQLSERFSRGGRLLLRPVRLTEAKYSFPNGQSPHPPGWEPAFRLFGETSINTFVKRYHLPFSNERALLEIPRPPVIGEHRCSSNWMVDLQLQFHPDRYEYTNVRPDWTLPKRRGLAELFFRDAECRVVSGGLPSLQVSASTPTVAIQVPTDRTVFCSLLLDHPYCGHESVPAQPRRLKDMWASDEGVTLRGMITLFGGLWYCGHQFAQPFWRSILSEMAAAAPGHRDRRRTLATLSQHFGILNSDAIKSGIDVEYWKAYPSFDEDFHRAFDELVERGVLQQGVEIRCPSCGSLYWYAVDQLRPHVRCLGCRTSIALPTETEWSFRLNDLVANALQPREDLTCPSCGTDVPIGPRAKRAKGTLADVQALYSLQNEAHTGMFLALPCQDLAIEHGGPREMELDVVAIVGNRFMIGEVKSHPNGFRQDEIDRAVAVAEELRPDELVLAAPGEDWSDELLGRIEDARTKLSHMSITLRVLKMRW